MPYGALPLAPQPQGQAAFWQEAHCHPLLSSPLTRWGLFSNCDFISNYCLHTDAASHRRGKYTMSQIITWGPARAGLSWKHEEPPAPTGYYFCMGQQQAQRYWGFYASKESPQAPRGDLHECDSTRPFQGYSHLQSLELLSLTRKSEVVGR